MIKFTACYCVCFRIRLFTTQNAKRIVFYCPQTIFCGRKTHKLELTKLNTLKSTKWMFSVILYPFCIISSVFFLFHFVSSVILTTIEIVRDKLKTTTTAKHFVSYDTLLLPSTSVIGRHGDQNIAFYDFDVKGKYFAILFFF